VNFPECQHWVRNLWRESLDWLWPRHCDLCQQLLQTESGQVVCADCRSKLVADPWSTCPRCASTTGPHTQVTDGCPKCLNESFAFVGVQRMGPYEGSLREAILRVKWSSGELLAEELGQVFGEKLKSTLQTAYDVIVPIPLHWRRQWERGYNQSLAIARGLANVLALPLRASWIVRQRNTPHQTSVSASQRRENIRGAFRVRRGVPIHNLRVLLVDDVLTTGSTAHAASRVLLDAGAAQVSVVVLAHR
jgi:ComF family protein